MSILPPPHPGCHHIHSSSQAVTVCFAHSLPFVWSTSSSPLWKSTWIWTLGCVRILTLHMWIIMDQNPYLSNSFGSPIMILSPLHHSQDAHIHICTACFYLFSSSIHQSNLSACQQLSLLLPLVCLSLNTLDNFNYHLAQLLYQSWKKLIVKIAYSFHFPPVSLAFSVGCYESFSEIPFPRIPTI